jgi:beta-mannosidase
LVPGTVAASLRESGRWSLDSAPRQFDAQDWWYRTRFTAEPAAAGERVILGFDGLATLADVWLNGVLLLNSTNMFVEHRCDVGALLAGDNELIIRFSSLDAFLKARRPRPRWRTPMVAHQQLRWARTTLLGRTPGWSPPAAAVGPWRPVWLERRRQLDFDGLRLRATLADGCGKVALSCELTGVAPSRLISAELRVSRGAARHAVGLSVLPAPVRLEGELSIPNPDLWWPHTHGDPALYDAVLQVTLAPVGQGVSSVIEVDLGTVGFRRLHLDREGGRFAFRVNGVEVFCRGASWTPLDCVSLHASREDHESAVRRVVEAGMNMLRVAGPMVYESDLFLDLCDSRGILLWQDFMFANMDYPAEDEEFLASVRREARQQLARLQARPSLALLCGNGEGAQQAAMSGASRERWAPVLFDTHLAVLSQEYCADVPYCPSSTHGGAFPHQSSAGASSYYGVGAYLRPLTDARRSEVRFASECLAFANVPENETLALLAPDAPLRCHHGLWKERVPRDQGAGWDFEDVRDHYAAELYGADPMRMRYADHDRYLRVARAASGEVMAACFAEWRRARSTCRGALVWFLGDLWPGAGWGVVDSTGLPKAAYYYLKRALQPIALFISDEGTNGLALHVANDGQARLRARLQLRLYRFSEPVGSVAETLLTIDAASVMELPATDLLEGFSDLSYAYRFGPPPYDVLVASLSREDGASLAEAFYFPLGLPNALQPDLGLKATLTPLGGHTPMDGQSYALHIHSRLFAQSVHVEMPGFVADDQYFHMAPNSTRALTLRARAPVRAPSRAPERAAAAPPRLHGMVHALNAAASCRISVAA